MAKGDKSVLAMSVNDIKANESGNVALTAANVGADTAGAAQVVQGNLQAHIIDSVIHMTQDERDDLAAKLSELSAAISANSSALANKADADWVKALTQQPLAQGVTILDRIRELEENGIYRGTFQAIASADTPEDSTGWGFNISFFHGEKTVVFAVKSYFPLYWFRQIDSNGWIGDWIPIATATKPAVYDLPLAAGWSAISAKYCRTQDGMITVNVLGLTNGSGTAGYSVFGILPEGYRPYATILAPAINTGGWTITNAGHPLGTISEAIFWSDGYLCIERTDATASQCSFNATFLSA